MLADTDMFGLPEAVRRLVRFACTHMVRSYKPATLALMLGLADDRGRTGLDPPSRGGVCDERVLLVECPIDQFERARHLEMLPSGVLRIVPEEVERGLVTEPRVLAVNCCQRAVSCYYRKLSLDKWDPSWSATET